MWTGDVREVRVRYFISLLIFALIADELVVGELLASAGDDGNILVWVPAENQTVHTNFGEDGLEDKETWRVKLMCRSMGSEIYDLAWSPDGRFVVYSFRGGRPAAGVARTAWQSSEVEILAATGPGPLLRPQTI